METKGSPIPPLLLERAALGELNAAELEKLRQRFGPSFDTRVEELVAQNKSWAQGSTRDLELKQIKHRAEAQAEPKGWRNWYMVPATAAVACLALLWIVRDQEPPLPSGDRMAMADTPQPGMQDAPGTRLKGLSPHLTLHRKIDKGQERLAPGASAKQGDVIQLSYIAASAKFGVIVSIDGVGQTTLHYPSQEVGSTTLKRNGKVPLEQSYELDNAPHFERFFLITSDAKKAPADFVSKVLRAAKEFAKSPASVVRAQALPLPSSWSQSSFLLRKADASR